MKGSRLRRVCANSLEVSLGRLQALEPFLRGFCWLEAVRSTMWTPLTMNGNRHLADAAALARPSYSFLAPFVRPSDTSSMRRDAIGPFNVEERRVSTATCE